MFPVGDEGMSSPMYEPASPPCTSRRDACSNRHSRDATGPDNGDCGAGDSDPRDDSGD